MTTTINIQKSELATAASIVQPFFTKKMPPLSCIQMRLKDKRLEMFTSLGFEGGSAYAAILFLLLPFKTAGLSFSSTVID